MTSSCKKLPWILMPDLQWLQQHNNNRITVAYKEIKNKIMKFYNFKILMN